MPREFIAARLRLDEVLDDMMQAGQWPLVLEAIDLVRADLRMLAKHARTVAQAERPAPRKGQRPVDDKLSEALAQIEVAMARNAARNAQAREAENVAFMSDQLEKRRERLKRGPHPPLLL